MTPGVTRLILGDLTAEAYNRLRQIIYGTDGPISGPEYEAAVDPIAAISITVSRPPGSTT